MVSMLLAQALFLGIFIGTFDISAHSLFLAVFDEKMLAKAYIVSGLAGIILLSVYFALQATRKIQKFWISKSFSRHCNYPFPLDITCE